jgi:hypothetical protein
MLRRSIVLIALIGMLVGCATAAQRQAKAIGSTLSATREQGKACFATINDDPAFAEIERHFPLANIENATLPQMTDQSFATPREVELLSARRDRQIPCRQAFVAGYNSVAPSLAMVWQDIYSKSDANLVLMATKQIRWGEFVGRQKATLNAGSGRLTEAAQRLGAELDARSEQEMAQRAAAAQSFSNTMYQQQLINQNQQMINNANRPVTTNCNSFGNSVNCRSY